MTVFIRQATIESSRTMTKLTKCIYGYETDPKKTPFGLLNNQIRIDNIIQNAGWFNHKGERLGQGDLTLKEMQRIAKNISPLEAFFVLTESDSSWDMPNHLDRTSPGIQYVTQKASWGIFPSYKGGLIIRIREDIKEREEVTRDGVKFTRVPREALNKALTAPPKPTTTVKKAEAPVEKTDVAVDAKSVPLPAPAVVPAPTSVTNPATPSAAPTSPAVPKKPTVKKTTTTTTKSSIFKTLPAAPATKPATSPLIPGSARPKKVKTATIAKPTAKPSENNP